ncbi:hypothetical protein NDU88_006578 [Pleurodeles waltl]|uniref:Uncharacterized protein n=1 Tax=Pleurodeles waltl TaxID=8319 RepID=A0AAV7WXZ1_PLEWA|nr:hypothetical protein NDU88_006578 [Pleurodeles waltl]
MLVATYRNALWHMPTPARSLRSVIKQTIIEVLVAAVGITRAIRSLSQAIIINMAPKANRHLGDKNEGAKTMRSGRGKGEPLGSNKRLASTTGKAGGENATILGQMTDAKMSTKASDSTTPLLEDKAKGKNQSTITAFLAGGMQRTSVVMATSSSETDCLVKGSSSLDSSTRNPDHSDNPTANMSENQDISREATRKVLSLCENGQLQTQQVEQCEQADLQNKGKPVGLSGYTAEENEPANPPGSPKIRDQIMGEGKNLQLIDWGRESSDKFYSLTEESDPGSADCSFSETDESEISETGNKSASGECTVHKARQRKSVKSRSGLQEGSESMASRNGRSLRWDYTGINLADTSTGGNQSSAKDKNGSDPGPAAGEIGATGRNYEIGTDVGILQSIYSSIKELQTETRIDSHRARVATKRLQGSVRKVAKSCKEIEAKLCSMEDRIVAVEDDMDTLKEQNATRDGQLTDFFSRDNDGFQDVLKGWVPARDPCVTLAGCSMYCIGLWARPSESKSFYLVALPMAISSDP